MPTIIANEIVGVQYMNVGVGTLYSIPLKKRTLKCYITEVDLHWNCSFNANPETIELIEEWLKSLPKTLYWTYQHNPFSMYFINFYDKEILTMFKLKWDGYTE